MTKTVKQADLAALLLRDLDVQLVGEPKAFLKSLTVNLNLVGGVILAILTATSTPEFAIFTELLPMKARVYIAGALGVLLTVANIIRAVTDKARGPVAPPDVKAVIKRLRGTNVNVALLLIACSVLLVSCGSVKAVTEFQFPELATIATPDQADEVLATGTYAYQLVVGGINALHDAKLFPDGEWEELIARDGSPAQQLRDGLQRGLELAAQWREGGDRAAFDALYKTLSDRYGELLKKKKLFGSAR